MLFLPDRNYDFEIGIDEVGRGCLAFDAYVAAVAYPKDILHRFFDGPDEKIMDGIKDSKKMTPQMRNKAEDVIKRYASYWTVNRATVEDIDRINIFNAIQESMELGVRNAMDNLPKNDKKYKVLIDGDRFLAMDRFRDGDCINIECIPGGDAQYLSIASASVLAKVQRDRDVLSITERHKEEEWQHKYGFISNKAYGTKYHLDGLRKYGVCPYHRMSFNPMKNMFAFRDAYD